MENIKEIIAKNLTELRKKHKLTQGALAERLNYSDKAISRWERAETLPDIEVLCQICELYGVKFEYLLQKEQPEDAKNPYVNEKDTVSKISISLIAMCTVWIMASVLFAVLNIYFNQVRWTIFIWGVPATCIVGWVCNAMWGNKVLKVIIASIMTWSTILALFIEALVEINLNLWFLFIIGVPIQMIIILSTTLKKSAHRKN